MGNTKVSKDTFKPIECITSDKLHKPIFDLNLSEASGLVEVSKCIGGFNNTILLPTDLITKLRPIEVISDELVLKKKISKEIGNSITFHVQSGLLYYFEEVNKLVFEREKIIKLNEELAAENARLLMELEHSEKDFVDKTIQSANRLFELSTIKSKWWYKLMTWGW